MNAAEHKTIHGPRDLFLVLWRGWIVIAFFVAVECLSAVLDLHRQPALYQAQMVATPVSATETNAASARLGNLSGLASLAGVSIPNSQNPGNFRLYIELLRSREVADELAQNPVLMQTIFAREWDKQDKVWRQPSQPLSARVESEVDHLLGFPPEHWQPPDGARLRGFLNNTMQIQEDPRKSYLVTVAFSWFDPAFAISLLDAVNKAADNRLRKAALLQANDYIDYLSRKLDTVTAAEYREAIMVTLAEQEKYAMSASSGTPFAAQLLDRPAASPDPISPQPRQAFIKAIAFGVILGSAVVLGWLYLGDSVRRWLKARGISKKLPALVRKPLRL